MQRVLEFVLREGAVPPARLQLAAGLGERLLCLWLLLLLGWQVLVEHVDDHAVRRLQGLLAPALTASHIVVAVLVMEGTIRWALLHGLQSGQRLSTRRQFILAIGLCHSACCCGAEGFAVVAALDMVAHWVVAHSL